VEGGGGEQLEVDGRDRAQQKLHLLPELERLQAHVQLELRGPRRVGEEREELDLLYDGILNCYYDPRTNKYYELA